MSGKIARKVHKDINFKILIPIMILLLAVLLVGGWTIIGSSDTVADNVYVNSISLGGLSAQEAKSKLSENITDEYFNKSVFVKYNDNSFEVYLNEVVSVDIDKTVEDALSKKPLLKNDKLIIPFQLTVNTDKVKTDMKSYFISVENMDEMFSFNEDYTMVTVDSSKFKEIIDVEGTINLLIENVKNDVYEDIKALTLMPKDKGYGDALYNCLVRPPVDASVGMNDDKTTFIIPEVIGVDADKEEFKKLYENNDGKFQIKIKATHSKVKTKDLDIAYYQDTLGTYTSAYNTGLINRTKNVALAARLVNGTIIMPGKRFSYNNVVGPRTYERGFVDATVYTGEGTEEGIGGGICQVSSTIYCAQLRANLKTVSRSNHSYTVVYVPLGQDATVVYGAIDYVFENNTTYPIKIEAYANGGYLTVNIKGTKSDPSLSYDVVSVYNSTTPKQEVTKETANLPVGETSVSQEGQNGAVVSLYKIYYKNGVEQKREFVDKSVYKPMNKIVLVGIGEGEVTDTEPEDDVNNEIPPETEPTVNEIEPGADIGDDIVVEEGETTEPDTADSQSQPTTDEPPSLSDIGL